MEKKNLYMLRGISTIEPPARLPRFCRCVEQVNYSGYVFFYFLTKPSPESGTVAVWRLKYPYKLDPGYRPFKQVDCL